MSDRITSGWLYRKLHKQEEESTPSFVEQYDSTEDSREGGQESPFKSLWDAPSVNVSRLDRHGRTRYRQKKATILSYIAYFMVFGFVLSFSTFFMRDIYSLPEVLVIWSRRLLILYVTFTLYVLLRVPEYRDYKLVLAITSLILLVYLYFTGA